MFAVVQTSFEGIDALDYQEIPRPVCTDDSVIVKMMALPVTPTNWKMETNPHATADNFSALPRVIGVGGAGEIVEVGKNRAANLLGKKALVLSPRTGAYCEFVANNNPDWLLPLPDNVSPEAAACLIAGADTAKLLKSEIEASTAQQILITGANSVIGLFLFQLLEADPRIIPIVSAASKAYFAEKVTHFTAQTSEELPEQLPAETLILDIAGSEKLLAELLSHCPSAELASIALMQTENVRFIAGDFDVHDARQFIAQLSAGTLHAPIGQRFPINQTKEAQHFAKDNHSRGRVIVTF